MQTVLLKRALSTTAGRFAAATARSSHAGGMALWKKFSLFGALPCVTILTVFIITEHKGHHEEPKEYIPYDHLRKRDKRYPWGDGTRTLFHNPHSNWHPDGH